MLTRRFHPVHMLIVHFPAALLPMDFIFRFAGEYFGQEALASTGYYCLMAGVILGWLTVLTGLVDFFLYFVNRPSEQLTKLWLHAGFQATMLFGFTVVLSLEYKNPIFQTDLPMSLWLTKGALILLLFAGNYFGGELVLKFVSKRFSE